MKNKQIISRSEPQSTETVTFFRVEVHYFLAKTTAGHTQSPSDCYFLNIKLQSSYKYLVALLNEQISEGTTQYI
jgi:hypothetical protein